MQTTPACRFLCLSLCVALSALLPTEALAAQGITRTSGEDFNGAQSITVLKGDTVWFWAEEVIDGSECIWEPWGPLEWPLDGDMTWSLTQGELDDPHQYFRDVVWERFEEGPPFPVLIEVIERWQGSKTFDSSGHFEFEVVLSYSGGPPKNPVVFTFEAYVVEAYVSSVAFGLEYEGQLYRSVTMRKSAGIPWQEMLYADPGDPYLPQPEWRLDPPRALPVCFIKGESPVLEAVLGLTPAFQGAPSLPLEIQATSQGMYWSGTGSGFPEVQARVYTLDELPEEVAHDDDRQFTWQARAAGTAAFHDLGDIGIPFWVTWDMSSGSSRTAKRMDFATENADGSGSEEAIADGIHDALGGVGVDPPFERGEKEDLGEGWELLDGLTYGECDEQAYLMELAVRMLGVPALTRGVYASSDAGAGNCLELEHKFEQVHQWLVLDFDTGAGYAWNAVEGCCVTADHYYSVLPKHKATNDYTLLLAVPCQQYWVKTEDDTPPGAEGGWKVEAVYDEEPKP